MVKNFSVINGVHTPQNWRLQPKTATQKFCPSNRGHLQCRDTFAWIQECPLKRGTTVPACFMIKNKSSFNLNYFEDLQ